MKVIIQTNSIKYPLTGIGRYTYELAKNLPLQIGIDNIKYFHGWKFIENLDTTRDLSSGNTTLTKRIEIKSYLLAKIFYLVFPLIQGLNLKRYKDYIYHGPNYYLPYCLSKSVVTIHDLSMFSWSWCHPSGRVGILQRAINYSVKNASMLITDSEFVRQELAQLYSLPLEKIVSVPLAAGNEFKVRTNEQVITILDKYNLHFKGYGLFVGTIEPRKNIKTLLVAYKKMPLDIRLRFPLLIIGYKGWESEDIHSSMQQAEAESWLKYIGYVEADDLPYIYSGARLFIFPSLYEGFGLPVLEAMASGVPVVCSNSSSLPEVVGSAAAMCDPENINEFTRLITIGLLDGKWRTQAIEAGLTQSKKFSWERCAKETAEVYKLLVAK